VPLYPIRSWFRKQDAAVCIHGDVGWGIETSRQTSVHRKEEDAVWTEFLKSIPVDEEDIAVVVHDDSP
jgi:hypothetical protein